MVLSEGWVRFPPGTSIFCNNDRKNSLLLFLFNLAMGVDDAHNQMKQIEIT